MNTRLLGVCLSLFVFVCAAAPVAAQTITPAPTAPQPPPPETTPPRQQTAPLFPVEDDWAIGENYHIEGSVTFWRPTPELIVNVSGLSVGGQELGILGTDINLTEDLGITEKWHPELHLVLRPGKRHKIRFNYLPIRYATDNFPVTRTFVFDGQSYSVGLPVSTTVDLTMYRFGYEFDFISRSRGYLGALIDVKYNDISVGLDSPIGGAFTDLTFLFPTIGLTGRGYVARNVSITGEFSFIKIPDALSDEYDGHFYDIDLYGTVNITNNVGAQVGYRTFNVMYDAEREHADLQFKGLYFGGVVRY